MAWRFSFIDLLTAFFRAQPPASVHEEPEEIDLHLSAAQGFSPESTVTPHPTGKGVFVQTVGKATRAGTPEALAEFCSDLGMDWVMLLCIWQHDDRDRIYSQVPEAAEALRGKGIDVWLWGWPHPDRIDDFVDHMTTMESDTKAEGIVLNVEKPFWGKRWGKPKFSKQAESLMIRLRAQLGDDSPIGLSSYGAQFFFRKTFPWSVFAKYCDFGMPQIYDSKHKQGADYAERCFKAWSEFFDVVLPTWGASKAHTGQQMEDMISRTPLAPACSWWDLNHLRYSGKRQAVVRDHEILG